MGVSHLHTGYNTLLASLSLLALLCSPVALAEKKSEAPKQALSVVQQRLEALKKQLSSSQEAHKDAADALKDSEVAISHCVTKKSVYWISACSGPLKYILIKQQQKLITLLEKN